MPSSDYSPVLQELIYLAVAAGIGVVFLVLFLVHKIIEYRREIKILNRSKEGIKRVREFLDEGFRRTKAFNASGRALKLKKESVALRSAYLKIEYKALDLPLDSEKYWSFLDEHLEKLLKIMLPELFNKNAQIKQLNEKVNLLKQRISKMPVNPDDTRSSQYRKNAITALNNFSQRYRDSHNHQDHILEAVDKMENVVAVFENPESRREHVRKQRWRGFQDRNSSTLKKLDQHREATLNSAENLAANVKGDDNDTIQKELDKFRTENAKLNKKIKQLKNDVAFTTSSSSDSYDDKSGKPHTTESLQDLSEELLRESESEIERLRSVVNNQRMSMMTLEEKLAELDKSDESGSANSEEVEQLRRAIQESELCIQMLEDELTHLKTDLEEVRQAAANESISATENNSLVVDIEQVRTELEEAINESQKYQSILSFVEDALSARTIEDLSLLIFETLVSFNATPVLIIKSPERNFELSTSGKLSTRDKVVLENMRIDEATPSDDGSLTLRYLNIAGIFRPATPETSLSEVHEQVLNMVKIADKLVSMHIQAEKSKRASTTLDECANNIKKTSYDLDKAIESYLARNKTLISNCVGQIKDMARAKGLGASQISAFTAVEQETLKQLDADRSIRLKLRKQFLALLNELE